MPEQPSIRAGVVGASGYAGALAADLLWRHPNVELEIVTARSEIGRRLDDLYPRYRVPLAYEDFDPGKLGELDVVLVSLPHAAAATSVDALRERGVRVVDLSADFRLGKDDYERWYGEHAAPERLDEAVFGLTELHRDEIRKANLVANPGCYSTAAILALAPLAKAGLIGHAVVDGKSGVSGAGREATEKTHFVSVDENVSPYALGGHRHSAEIDQELARLGHPGATAFVPHLLPLDQGLLASCYVQPSSDLDSARVRSLFEQMYEGEFFIELSGKPPGVRDVCNTNFCRVHVSMAPDGTVCSFAAIDNLWKGAAGQAVQNLNLMFGLDERTGLE